MRVSRVLKAKRGKIVTVGSDDVVETASRRIAQGGSEEGTLLRDLAFDGFATYSADLYEPIRLPADSDAALRPLAEP